MIKYYLNLGLLGEDVECVIDYDYTREDADTTAPEVIDITDVKVSGMVLDQNHIDNLLISLNEDEMLLDAIRDIELNRYYDYMVDRADFLHNEAR